MNGKWCSLDAVLWVLDEAPGLPSHLVSTLIAVARYTDETGHGAYPSASTVAAHTRKTERQAKRDLAELAKLGFLAPGDSRIVASIRADKRPAVYDLATPRGDTHVTPQSNSGVTPMTARGDIQGPSGVSPTSPKEVLKTSVKSPRANSAGALAHGHPTPQPPRGSAWLCPGETLQPPATAESEAKQQALDTMYAKLGKLREKRTQNTP